MMPIFFVTRRFHFRVGSEVLTINRKDAGS